MARYEHNVHPINIDGGTTSDAIRLGFGETPVKLYAPASIASSSVTFTMSDTAGGSYDALLDASSVAVTITLTADSWHVLDPSTFAGIQYMKLEVSDSETDKDYKLITTRLVG